MTPDEQRRFLNAIDFTNGCWLWKRSTGSHGYGQFLVGGRNMTAHRVAYAHWVGPIPDGAQVLHSCDVKRCVRPEHLYLGDNALNRQEAFVRGRQPIGDRHNAQKTHCAQGHPYDEANTRRWKGKRICRACAREKAARSYRRHVNADPKPKNSERTHCPQGHPYNEANTYLHPSGRRACRACRTEQGRDWYRKSKE